LKPLILKGARQVGKTQLMLELGKKCFANYCYCNFDVDGEDDIKPIFEKTNNPSEIIKLLENQKQIRITNKTLLIFDEIHRAPKVMSALKYFAELSDGYKIICSTSLLSEILHYKNSEISFPVGKIEELEIHPLDFEEFLLWTNPFLYESYVNINLTRVIEINLHNQLKNKYKDYLIVGGMPECVLE
jgi:predicted AAA+ superfamily ATPase